MIQWEEEDKVNVVLYNQEIRCLQPRINNKALKTKQKSISAMLIERKFDSYILEALSST